jgi:hypothetical protein
MSISPRPLAAGLCAVAFAVGVTACGEVASTSNFKGESHKVAQTIANFQTDATANNQKKLCEDDLADALTARFKNVGGCETVIKNALHGLDSLNLTIEAITVNGATAQAHVRSTWSGKNRTTTLTLVKEGAHWKISGAQSR